MVQIEYTETDEQGLNSTYDLRQKIIEYHKARSPEYFFKRYASMDVSCGNELLLEKAVKGGIRLDLARDTDTDELVGYCIISISGDRQGEIESIFIEPDYRRLGIGDELMKRALRWMDEYPVTKKVLGVGAGNEDVFEFYRKYNFYPRTTVLEQVEVEEE